MRLWLALGAGTLAAALLTGCGGDDSNDNLPSSETPAVSGVKLNFMGRYSTGQFDESAAEIPAYGACSWSTPRKARSTCWAWTTPPTRRWWIR